MEDTKAKIERLEREANAGNKAAAKELAELRELCSRPTVKDLAPVVLT